MLATATAAAFTSPLVLASTASADEETGSLRSLQAWQLTVIDYAKSKINGEPYQWGGNGPDRFDCSGLTSQAYKAAGFDFTATHRTSQRQDTFPNVSRDSVIPGDLVTFSFSGHADHVGLYVGPIGPNGEDFIDTSSSHPGGGVGWSTLSTRGPIESVVRPSLDSGFTGSTAAAPKPQRTSEPAPAPEPEPRPEEGAEEYTVVPGDTLSGIAERHGTTWRVLYEINDGKIDDPDLIFPGQTFKVER